MTESLGGGVVLLTLLLTFQTQADELDIEPASIQLESSFDSAELIVSNFSGRTMSIRVRVFSWSQPGGHDTFKLSRDLVVEPQAFTLAAGDSREVRINLERDTDLAEEAAYRVFFDDMPAAGSSRRQAPLSFAAPVFVVPGAPFESDLEWSLQSGAGGTLHLRARNPGNVHVQVESLVIENGRVSREIPASFGYVLAGQEWSWNVPSDLALDPTDSLEVRVATRYDLATHPVDWEDW